MESASKFKFLKQVWYIDWINIKMLSKTDFKTINTIIKNARWYDDDCKMSHRRIILYICIPIKNRKWLWNIGFGFLTKVQITRYWKIQVVKGCKMTQRRIFNLMAYSNKEQKVAVKKWFSFFDYPSNNLKTVFFLIWNILRTA